MNRRIETPTVSEILNEEFMIPLNVSPYALAKSIDIPVSTIQDILHGRGKITADISLRLAKFFDVSDDYFLNIQQDIDYRSINVNIKENVAYIREYQNI